MSINVLQAKQIIASLPMAEHATLVKKVKRLDPDERCIVRQAFEVVQYGISKAKINKAPLHQNKVIAIVNKMVQPVAPEEAKKKRSFFETIEKCFESFCKGLENLLGTRIGSGSLVHFIEKHTNIIKQAKQNVCKLMAPISIAELEVEFRRLGKGREQLNQLLNSELEQSQIDLLKQDEEFKPFVEAFQSELDGVKRKDDLTAALFKVAAREGIVQAVIGNLKEGQKLEDLHEKLGRIPKLKNSLNYILKQMQENADEEELHEFANSEFNRLIEQCGPRGLTVILCKDLPTHLHTKRLAGLKENFEEFKRRLDGSTSISSTLEQYLDELEKEVRELTYKIAVLEGRKIEMPELPKKKPVKVRKKEVAQVALPTVSQMKKKQFEEGLQQAFRSMRKELEERAIKIGQPTSELERTQELIGRKGLVRAILLWPLLDTLKDDAKKEDMTSLLIYRVLSLIELIDTKSASFDEDVDASLSEFRLNELKLDLIRWVDTLRVNVPIKAQVEYKIWFEGKMKNGLQREVPDLQMEVRERQVAALQEQLRQTFDSKRAELEERAASIAAPRGELDAVQEERGRLALVREVLLNPLLESINDRTKEEDFISLGMGRILKLIELIDANPRRFCRDVSPELSKFRLNKLKLDLMTWINTLRVNAPIKAQIEYHIWFLAEKEKGLQREVPDLQMEVRKGQIAAWQKQLQKTFHSKRSELQNLAANIAKPTSELDQVQEESGRLALVRQLLLQPLLAMMQKGVKHEDFIPMVEERILKLIAKIEKNPHRFHEDVDASLSEFRLNELKLDLFGWVDTLRANVPIKAQLEHKIWISEHREAGLRKSIPGLQIMESRKERIAAIREELGQLAVVRTDFLEPLYNTVANLRITDAAFYIFSVLRPKLEEQQEALESQPDSLTVRKLKEYFMNYAAQEFDLDVKGQLERELNGLKACEIELNEELAKLYQV